MRFFEIFPNVCAAVAISSDEADSSSEEAATSSMAAEFFFCYLAGIVRFPHDKTFLTYDVFHKRMRTNDVPV